jgi:hypothetical protein
MEEDQNNLRETLEEEEQGKKNTEKQLYTLQAQVSASSTPSKLRLVPATIQFCPLSCMYYTTLLNA